MKKIGMLLFSVVFCTLFLIGCQGQTEVLNEIENIAEKSSAIFSEDSSEVDSEVLSEDGSGDDSEVLSEDGSGDDSDVLSEDGSESDSDNVSERVQENSSVLTIAEDGIYTGKDEVALYIHTYGKLPPNYITKKDAQKQGWDNKKNTMADALPGMSIGGDHFGNYEGNLPEKKGRSYKECDIDYEKGGRNAKRIVFSNDGLIFYTEDHYSSFEQLY